MKSILGLILFILTFVGLLGGSAAIWYLSENTEFSRKAEAPVAGESR